jgi:hypothetical protein
MILFFFNFYLFYLGSAVLHIILTFRIRKYKMKQPKNNTVGQSKNNSFLFSIENKAMESIGLFVTNVVVVLLGFFTSFKVNSLSAVESNFYPNYLYVNYFHLVNPIIVTGFNSTVYFLKHEKMKHFIMKELKKRFHSAENM